MWSDFWVSCPLEITGSSTQGASACRGRDTWKCAWYWSGSISEAPHGAGTGRQWFGGGVGRSTGAWQSSNLGLGWILGTVESLSWKCIREDEAIFEKKICRYWIADKNKTPSRIKGLKGVKYVALGRGTPRSYATSLQFVQNIVKPRLSRAAWVDLQSESPQQHVNKPCRSSFHWFQGVREVQWDTGEARSFATCLV